MAQQENLRQMLMEKFYLPNLQNNKEFKHVSKHVVTQFLQQLVALQGSFPKLFVCLLLE